MHKSGVWYPADNKPDTNIYEEDLIDKVVSEVTHE